VRSTRGFEGCSATGISAAFRRRRVRVCVSETAAAAVDYLVDGNRKSASASFFSNYGLAVNEREGSNGVGSSNGVGASSPTNSFCGHKGLSLLPTWDAYFICSVDWCISLRIFSRLNPRIRRDGSAPASPSPHVGSCAVSISPRKATSRSGVSTKPTSSLNLRQREGIKRSYLAALCFTHSCPQGAPPAIVSPPYQRGRIRKERICMDVSSDKRASPRHMSAWCSQRWVLAAWRARCDRLSDLNTDSRGGA